MPIGDWLYAYGVVRCKNPKCRKVYREHYERCSGCGQPNPKKPTSDEENPDA